MYFFLSGNKIIPTMPYSGGYMSDRLKYERFLWFHGQIKAGRFPNAGNLADNFELSGRTAQRDIEFIRELIKTILSHGTDIEVLEQLELRTLVKEEIDRMTKIYLWYDIVWHSGGGMVRYTSK
jgi:predicted DNA-binding transcriptional regulator YafY